MYEISRVRGPVFNIYVHITRGNDQIENGSIFYKGRPDYNNVFNNAFTQTPGKACSGTNFINV